MKIKKLFIALLLSFASINSFALSDGQAALLGIVIGSQLGRGAVYVQPAQVYVYPTQPQPVYVPRPVVIDSSQALYYDPQLHGYCAPYRDEMYAQCIGNMRRKNLEDAYQRGFRGY